MTDIKPPRMSADERSTLVALLQFQRQSLVRKVTGLDGDDARRELVGSATTLLWLVRHMAGAELRWVVHRFAGQEVEIIDEVAPDDTIDQAVADYRSAWARVDAIVAATPSLDTESDIHIGPAPVNLRWVLMHLLEETARHAGHADILRELIDGSTGRCGPSRLRSADRPQTDRQLHKPTEQPPTDHHGLHQPGIAEEGGRWRHHPLPSLGARPVHLGVELQPVHPVPHPERLVRVGPGGGQVHRPVGQAEGVAVPLHHRQVRIAQSPVLGAQHRVEPTGTGQRHRDNPDLRGRTGGHLGTQRHRQLLGTQTDPQHRPPGHHRVGQQRALNSQPGMGGIVMDAHGAPQYHQPTDRLSFR